MHLKLITLLYMLATALTMHAQTGKETLPQLYKELDKALNNAQAYARKREADISQAKTTLSKQATPKGQYDASMRVYELYRPYQNDSCIAYLQRCIDLSRQRGEEGRQDELYCRMLLARQTSAVGYSTEALSIMHDIDRNALDSRGLATYYVTANHIYGELGRYALLADEGQRFYHLADAYADSMLVHLSETDQAAMEKRQALLIVQGKLEEAMTYNDRWLMLTEPFTHGYSLVAFYRQWIYSEMGRKEDKKRWLILSSLSDVRNAVNDQASLWDLASMLREEGDVERSSRYINYAWQASIDFGSRLRSLQISPLQTDIEAQMQQVKDSTRRRLVAGMVVLALLTVMLIALLYYADRQRSKVSDMSRSLAVTNRQLSASNLQLKEASALLDERNLQLEQANGSLEQANASLAVANKQLGEAARLKEEYIGQLIVSTSEESEHLNEFRRKMAKLLKARNYDAMFLELKEPERPQGKESARMFERFDATFLQLFPGFVQAFNGLIAADHQVVLRQPQRLNTVMRVFALIRLGIDDSNKIAEFLHCSVSTIYNYRVTMRNASLGDRATFEERVKML